MNIVQNIEQLPTADQFITELVRRIDDGFSKAIIPIGKAIVAAGGDRDQIVRFVGDPLTRAAFLLGCCAEEVASLGDRLSGGQEKKFIREVVEQLRLLRGPMAAKQVSPDFRRLLASFRESPARTRVQTVNYMLELSGLTDIRAMLDADPVCELAIECTVVTDGIVGALPDLVERGSHLTGRNLRKGSVR